MRWLAAFNHRMQLVLTLFLSSWASSISFCLVFPCSTVDWNVFHADYLSSVSPVAAPSQLNQLPIGNSNIILHEFTSSVAHHRFIASSDFNFFIGISVRFHSNNSFPPRISHRFVWIWLRCFISTPNSIFESNFQFHINWISLQFRPYIKNLGFKLLEIGFTASFSPQISA